MAKSKVFDGEVFYPVTEAAKLLQMSPATVRRYCDEGALEHARNSANGYRYVKKSAIDRFWKEMMKGLGEAT